LQYFSNKTLFFIFFIFILKAITFPLLKISVLCINGIGVRPLIITIAVAQLLTLWYWVIKEQAYPMLKS